MATILVTCVGSGVGQSVIDSLNLKREHKIIGCDGNRNVYAYSFCDDFYIVPSIYSENYLKYILDICVKNNVDIVVPGHDHELTLLSLQKEIFTNEGIEVLVSEPKIIEISRDKQRWYDFFNPLGCKIVPTISVKEFISELDESILPAIVKPSGGSASQGITIINDINELEGLNERDIIQPYLFPEKADKNYNSILSAVKKGKFVQMSEISIQLIFSKQSKFEAIFISKNSLKNGVPVFVDPINPDKFEYTKEILRFVPVLEREGVMGPVNIQGRITSKGLFFFEMNMRFTGITGNRALLGFNEVDFLVNNFLGKKGELNNYSYNKLGVRQVACTTIPRNEEEQRKSCLTVLGAGSSVGQAYISKVGNDYDCINLIVRKTSSEKYKKLFTQDKTNIIEIDDSNLEQVLCQTDVFINFVSALAYESDSAKFEAIRYVYDVVVKVTKAKIPLVINLSSQSVYPQTENVIKTEKHEVNYEKSYAFQKVIIEDFFTSINSLSPVSKTVSLRLPRIIIPFIPNQSGFFGKMINDYKEGKVINIDKPNNNTNLIHIDDVISAIQFVIENRFTKEYPSVLNVSGMNLSMKEYAEKIKQLVGEEKGGVEFGKNQKVEVSSMIEGSVFEGLGWKANKSIEDIINQL